MRYEDLVNDKKNTYEGIFKFLLELDSLEGTNAQRRIDEVLGMGQRAAQTYKFKATTGQLNTNTKRYSKEQADFIKNELADILYFFGYSNVDEESYSNFYHWDDHTPERKALHNGFRKVNEDSLKEVLVRPKVVKTYCHNQNRDMVEMFPPNIAKVQEPGLLFAQSCLNREGDKPADLGVKKQEV